MYADNYALCHGADGASGFTTDQFMYRPDDHVSVNVTADEIAAISAFLNGL